jgi:phosphatidylserine/phosphatidylglycerophosphate/cardiolipin synthase-like enzyme
MPLPEPVSSRPNGETATWLRVGTRRVIALFLETLANSHAWSRVFLVSPWISQIDIPGVITQVQLIKRLKDDKATLFVVTRPPEEDWHERALCQFRDSGVANIKLVPSLHSKLYYADTAQGQFAMIGSANFTSRSFANLEIGVLIRGSGAGTRIVRELSYEASSLYRCDGTIYSLKQFGGG